LQALTSEALQNNQTENCMRVGSNSVLFILFAEPIPQEIMETNNLGLLMMRLQM
jgi:hypothetical protein